MKYCPKCGKEVNGSYCSSCGHKVENSVSTSTGPSLIPYTPQYKPISAWGYFGYQILFAIPLIGFILLIVFSLSDSNINLRNYARSYWCALILIFVIAFIVGLLVGGFQAFN